LDGFTYLGAFKTIVQQPFDHRRRNATIKASDLSYKSIDLKHLSALKDIEEILLPPFQELKATIGG